MWSHLEKYAINRTSDNQNEWGYYIPHTHTKNGGIQHQLLTSQEITRHNVSSYGELYVTTYEIILSKMQEPEPNQASRSATDLQKI